MSDQHSISRKLIAVTLFLSVSLWLSLLWNCIAAWASGSGAVTLMALLLAGSIAVLFCAAFVIGGVARPLGELAGLAQQLSLRRFDVVIPGSDRADEFGAIARGLGQFRASTIANDQLDVEITARAEAEAAGAKARVIEQSFQAELGRLVQAASQGDFSRRVELQGKTGFLGQLGLGLNTWADSISNAFSQVKDVMAGLAEGDLTRRMDGQYKGDVAALQADINRMTEKLRDVTRKISSASSEVQGATREIAMGVLDLAGRTEHQASTLEQTSASMEQLAATVRQNAANAHEANALAAQASLSAGQGGTVVQHSMAAMARIESSSRQIGDIVGLIQDIAFQTNLLALNAAVEAARAGDAGKGFGVVATEVRALALRASQASKEIKALIVTSDSAVRDGVSLVKEAGQSLSGIVSSVQKVAGLMAEIAAATHEQSQGIEEVSRSVTGLDQITQQNAALVEETNAALHAAQGQMQGLREAIAFFQTGQNPVPESDHPLNPVRQQFQALARRIAQPKPARTAATAQWREF